MWRVTQDVVSADVAALAPFIVAALQQARALAPPAVLASGADDAATRGVLRQKEAVYSAACALEFELRNHVDFAEWLQGSLLPELQAVCGACWLHAARVR
jgi:hypothetical protein